eukprot:ANDGO_04448.mRNA.1 hypothetical protein
MKNTELLLTLRACCSKSERVQVFDGAWYASASRTLSDEHAPQIGRLIALLDDAVRKERICNKDECLLIYGLEPAETLSNYRVCIKVLVRAMSSIGATDVLNGRPMVVAVDFRSGKVQDVSPACRRLSTEDDSVKGTGHPVDTPGHVRQTASYTTASSASAEPSVCLTIGNLYEHEPSTCCAVWATDNPPDFERLWDGSLDREISSAQEMVPFETITEAFSYLQMNSECAACRFRFILECNCYCTEFKRHLEQHGLSATVVKILSIETHQKPSPQDPQTATAAAIRMQQTGADARPLAC